MADKITDKTIGEAVPDLIPYVMAEVVAEKAIYFQFKKKHADYPSWDKAKQEEADKEYSAEKERVLNYLLDRAETAFQYNEQFNKNVKSKKNGGNHGRDYIYMFMYHWAGLDDNGNLKTYQDEPKYQVSLERWYQEKARFEANKAEYDKLKK
jgi:hypothetical protein